MCLVVIKKCYETSSTGLGLKRVSRVIDCSIGDVEVFSVPNVRHLAENVARSVFGDLPGELVFESSESVGYTHTLHKFRILVKHSKYVGVRVVVRGKRAIRVLFTIPGDVNIRPRCRIAVYTPRLDFFRGDVARTTSVDQQPRGQVYIDLPVVYAILGVPRVDLSKWTLHIEGLVEKPVELTLPDLYELGVERVRIDFHCVTGWSVRDLEFTGVPVEGVVRLVRPLNSVKWVYVESLDRYSTIIPYEEFTARGVLIAVEMNGKPLDTLHGYPARLVVPHLYGWKSAKWISRLVFTDNYRDGYWEALGYHPRGRVDLEERFKAN